MHAQSNAIWQNCSAEPLTSPQISLLSHTLAKKRIPCRSNQVTTQADPFLFPTKVLCLRLQEANLVSTRGTTAGDSTARDSKHPHCYLHDQGIRDDSLDEEEEHTSNSSPDEHSTLTGTDKSFINKSDHLWHRTHSHRAKTHLDSCTK